MCQNSKWLWEEKFETKKFLLTKKEFLSVVQYIINLFTALSYLSRHYDFKIFMIQKYVLKAISIHNVNDVNQITVLGDLI